MRIGIDNALGIHPDALALRAERTQVLARNIANADTPGYKAQDIDFAQVLAQVRQPEELAQPNMRTHASHIAFDSGANTSTGLSDALQYRVPLMPSLDGNTVDVQMEQSAFAENSIQFLTSLRLLNGRLQGMMTAIKGE